MLPQPRWGIDRDDRPSASTCRSPSCCGCWRRCSVRAGAILRALPPLRPRHGRHRRARGRRGEHHGAGLPGHADPAGLRELARVLLPQRRADRARRARRRAAVRRARLAGRAQRVRRFATVQSGADSATDRRTSAGSSTCWWRLGLLDPAAGGRPFPSDVLGTAGLYILLGLGLNIVVGYAGLLDLGYVAFFAIGAYSIGLLTSPAVGPRPAADFWLVLPVVIAARSHGRPGDRRAGAPAAWRLPRHRDARASARSCACSSSPTGCKPWTGAGQGILGIPPTCLGPRFPTKDPEASTTRSCSSASSARSSPIGLANSRVGRAWNAMREDEDGGRGDRHQHDQLQAAGLRARRGLRVPGRCALRRQDRRRSSRTASRSSSRSPRWR